MGQCHIPGDGTYNLLVLVQNDIDDEIDTDQRARFLNVLPYRVSLYTPSAGFRLHHAAVVCLDGFARGYAGHYSLCTSRIACKVNCAQWEITDARNDHNRELLADIYTIHPKGIVIIGNTNQLNNWDKRNSFERFRRELSNPEVITYDELFERAKFIVGIPNTPEIEEEEEFPF